MLLFLLNTSKVWQRHHCCRQHAYYNIGMINDQAGMLSRLISSVAHQAGLDTREEQNWQTARQYTCKKKGGGKVQGTGHEHRATGRLCSGKGDCVYDGYTECARLLGKNSGLQPLMLQAHLSSL